MIKSVTHHSYFEKKPNKQMGRLQNNQSTGWVHPKSTHARPLAWANKNLNVFSFGFTWGLNNLSTHPPNRKS
jgi:hypothetical protein